MNERIKELAEQAGFMLWGNESWNPGDIVDWSARYDDELAKFAELIVQDVMNFFGDERISLHYLEQPCCEDSVYLLQSKIKEHFGVEE